MSRIWAHVNVKLLLTMRFTPRQVVPAVIAWRQFRSRCLLSTMLPAVRNLESLCSRYLIGTLSWFFSRLGLVTFLILISNAPKFVSLNMATVCGLLARTGLLVKRAKRTYIRNTTINSDSRSRSRQRYRCYPRRWSKVVRRSEARAG